MVAPVRIPTEKGNQGVTQNSWWGFDPEEAPELMWPASIVAYDRMRRTDAQCKSILSAATLPIRRTRWFIDPNGADETVTRFIASNLGLPLKGEAEVPQMRAQDRFSWDDHLRLALLEMTYGHSFFEQVYRVGPDGLAHLRRLGWRPPRTIDKVEVAADGGLVSITQQSVGTTDGALPRIGQPIPVSQLVAYVHEREGGNWLGQSVLRPAYKFWLLKDRMLRIQAQTIDRNGMGVPIYEAPDIVSRMPGATMEEIAAVEDAILADGEELAVSFRSGESAGAGIQHGAKLDMRGVTGELPDALPVIRYYDEQIGSAVLANFLKLGGSDSTGSYALGSTFADFFVMSLQSEALHIADVTNQHVVNDLVDLNFGPEVPAPKVAFDEIGTQQHATATGIAQLVGAGALLPEPELEAYLRDMFGIPPKSKQRNPSAPTNRRRQLIEALAALEDE